MGISKKIPKSIVILTHNYPSSRFDRQNAGIFVHDFARELIEQKISVSVVCSGEKDKSVNIQGVQVYFFSWGKDKKLGKIKLWNPLELVNLFFFFKKGLERCHEVVKKTKPDISLAMWAFPSGVFAYFLKQEFKIPYAIWALGSDIYIYAKLPVIGILMRKILREARILLADGMDLATKVRKISGKKCAFLPSASSFVTRKVETHKKNKKIILTFVGRMEKVKGPDILLSALVKIKNILEKFEVNFLGDGSLLPILKEQAEKDGISQHIKFYGNVNDKNKIANILSGSSWLIIPSRSDSIPLVFSEGMKNGTPVVASALPDLKYLIDKYKVGIHFKPESERKLASIIASLPDLKKEREIFHKNTTRVSELFSISKSTQRFLEIVYG